MDYKTATELLENGQSCECIEFFKSGGYDIEYAYALLLNDDLKLAESVIEPIDSIRADWLKKIIAIINGNIEYPTYFQIRNFLEIDLTIFIKSGRIDYVNAILRLADVFQGINSETYKFLGRGLLKNDFPKESKIFLDRSLESYYNDVELHYLFVEYYIYIKDYDKAKKSALTCLKINPEYYPAKKISEELFN